MVESSFNNDYYEDEDDKKSTIEKVKVSLGAISLTFSVLIFLKVHPAGVLLGFFIYFYKKRDKTFMVYSTIPLLLYVFFILVNPESVISQQRPTGPHNAFGLLSTGQYSVSYTHLTLPTKA